MKRTPFSRTRGAVEYAIRAVYALGWPFFRTSVPPMAHLVPLLADFPQRRLPSWHPAARNGHSHACEAAE